jgi:hypothetical protein
MRRYNIELDCDEAEANGSMYACTEGVWVKWEDVKELEMDHPEVTGTILGMVRRSVEDLQAENSRLRGALSDCVETLRYNLVVYARKDEPMMLESFNKGTKALEEKP